MPDNGVTLVSPRHADLRTLLLTLAAIAGLTTTYASVLHIANATTVAVSFLLVVVLAAASARLWVAGVAAFVAMLAFNFFFIPPVGTFTVADPQNWVALFSFLAVSLVASSVSAAIRSRAQDAISRAQLVDVRRAADLARQNEALKSALLASLAHDLKTPLTAIHVAAENLQAAWLTDEDRREQSALVLTEVARLSRLFESILDMARIEAGAVRTSREWVPASEIIEAARASVEPLLRQHPVDVRGDLPSLVQVDPRLTSAALSHLLSNAARYSPAGSRITIQVSAEDDGLHLSVRDHGPGVDAADLPHLFDRFYRGRSGARTAGTGMGLAIARGMLAAEQGRLLVENCDDGGARFTVVVPAPLRMAATEPTP